MSIDFKSIREIPNDPFGKLLALMSRKLSASLAKDTADQIDNPEDIFADGQDIETKLTWQNFAMTKKFNLNTDFVSTEQPDGDATCRLWLKGYNLGNQLRDWSGMERPGTLFGDPILVDGGPFDYGIFDGSIKSTAIRFNRPTSSLVNDEYITVPYDIRHRAAEGLATGISFFIRFRLFSLASEGGLNLTLFEKTDNTAQDDGVILKAQSDGKLFLHFKKAASIFSKETAAGTVTTNTVYDLWVTYTVSGNVLHIYIDNVDKTLSATADTPNFHGTTSNIDWWIFRRGEGSNGGHIYGDFYDFMVLREKIVSATDVSRHFTNKWTTANISFGKVIIADYFATKSGIISSFTLTSFTTASFTAG
jgi:hypothetical protein